MAYGNPNVKFQPKPAKKPFRPHRDRQRPQFRPVSPKVVTTDPATVSPRISVGKVFATVGKSVAPLVASILSPSRVADATINWGPEIHNNFVNAPPDLKEMVISEPEPLNVPVPVGKPYPFNQVDMIRPPIPEIPWADFKTWSYPGVTHSPKVGTTIINVPDFIVYEPIPLEADPYYDLWNIPDDLTFEDLFPETMLRNRHISKTTPETFPKTRSRVNEYGVTIEISRVNVKRKKVTRVKIRPTRQRASKPRKMDRKANRKWIKLAHKFISLTYGTYTEIIDFLEALAWNSYKINHRGNKVPAMALEKGHLGNILIGVMEGKYQLDTDQFLVDVVFMQAQDYIQGKLSKALVKEAIDSGGWNNPMGPQAFVNNINKSIKGLPLDVDNSWVEQQFNKGKDYVSKTF